MCNHNSFQFKIISAELRSTALIKKWAKRLLIYIYVNAFVVLIALQQATIISLGQRTSAALSQVAAVYVSSLIRMWGCIVYYEFLHRYVGVKKIYAEEMDTSRKYFWRGFRSVCLHAGVLDLLLYFYVVPLVGLLQNTGNSWWEYLEFIPKSLVLEMVFDFFHYWTHRYLHINKFLFRYIHDDHHDHTHPGPLSGLDLHPLDALFTNTLPIFLAMCICPRLTDWQWHLFIAYKTFLEVGGHCGLAFNSCSFPQCPVVQWWFKDLTLRVHDHDWHHAKPTKNFAKRSGVWDRVFGTYETPQIRKSDYQTKDNILKCVEAKKFL